MSTEGKQLAIACAQAADGIQAEDIRVIELTGISSVTDYMVICTGTSMPHLKGIIRDVEKTVFSDRKEHAASSEVNPESRWMILDYIDVMVHVMHEEMRDLYALEDLWANGKEVEWAPAE
ncbi:MAG: ribosome silencing factor [Akkermansiaceae bacterium]